jgi:PAS domain S-box-containing protein
MTTSSSEPRPRQAEDGFPDSGPLSDASLVAELGRRALTQSNNSIVMDEALAAISQRLNVEFAKILELVPSGEGFLLTAGIGWRPGYVGQVVVPLIPESQAGYTMQQGKVVIAEDLLAETRFRGMPLLHEHGIVSGISTVLKGRERIHGIITAHSASRHEFSPADVAFFESVAGVVSAAMDRRDTEGMLAASHQRLLLALEAGRLGTWEWNPHNGSVVWSEMVERTYGMQPGEFAGTVEAYLASIHPEDREYVANTITQALDEGRLEMEYRIVRRDGETRWLASRGLVIRDARGQPVQVLGVCADVTERKLDEEERESLVSRLQTAETRYRSLFEQVGDAILIANGKGRYLDANAAACELLGYEREELVRMRVTAVVAHGLAWESEKIGSFIATGDWTGELDLKRKDGSLVPVEAKVTTIRMPNGNLFVSVIRDITRRRQEERGQAFLSEASTILSSSLDYSQTLASLAKICVPFLADWCAVDILEAGRLRRVAVVHADPAKIEYAQQLLERYPPDVEGDAVLARILREGQSYCVPEITEGLVRALAPDEDAVEIVANLGLRSAVVVPLQARGRTLGVLTLATEASRKLTQDDLALAQDLGRRAGLAVDNARLYEESQAVQEDLRRANAAKDEFLGLVSHELRTPITTIYGGARLLRTRGDLIDTDSRQAVLGDIEHESERLHRIVEDLLALARVELGAEVATEPVLLQRLVDRTVAAFTKRRPDRLIEVRAALGTSPARASETYLEQVMLNLIDNADKYSPRDETIEVETKAGECEVVVSVMDHGPGIPPEEIDLIFERFYRSPSSARRAGGAGIGLTVCKRVLEAQDGRIWAEARAGGGLIVSFALPIYDENPS